MSRWDEGSWYTIPLDTERFTIIVNRGFIAFIKQNKGTLYKLHPLLTIQYKIQ